MIGILLPNSEWLDLFPGTSITVKRNNPILAEGVFIPGEYSLPMDIPLTDHNIRQLGHPHLISDTKSTRKIDQVRIFVDGIFYRKGTLYLGVASIREKRLKVEFKFGLSAYAEKIRSGKLPGLVDEEVVLDNTIYKKQVDTRYNDTITLEGNYSLMVNGNKYDAATMEDLAVAIEAGEQFVDCTYEANGFGGGADPYIKLVCAFSGFDTPLKVEPGNNQVWQMVTNIDEIQEPVLSAIEPWLTIAPPDDKIRFPMSINQKYRKQFQDNHYINFNAAGELIRNRVGDWVPDNRNIIQPYVKLSYVLEKIAEHLGVLLDGDFITTDYYLKGLIDSTNSISKPADLAGPEKFLFTKKSFNLRDLVPDITIADFLKSIQSRFNLAIYVNENTGSLRLQHREPILLNKDYRDITALTYDLESPEQVALDGVALLSNQPTSDALAPADKYLYGTSEELTIRTSCGSSAEETDNQSGLDMVIADIDSSPGLRLIFEGGIIEDNNAIFRNVSRSAPPGMGYLFQDMWEERWKFWLDWHTRRKKARSTVQMGMRELTKIDWEKKYRIDGTDFIIASTEEKITQEGIKPVKCMLYRA